MKIKVLCVVDYYLPGFHGGGPMRTIVNLCDLLAEDVEFSIVTRDRDLGADAPYRGVRVNKWQPLGNSRVYYSDPRSFGVAAAWKALAWRHFDIIYLNSFFGYSSSISICLRRLFQGGTASILVAPRGEFSPGALAIKPVKKRIYLGLAQFFGLYNNVCWHASTLMEAEDIRRVFPRADGKIHLAADPVSAEFTDAGTAGQVPNPSGALRIAFISRISPKKNLDGLLEVLSGVERRIDLAIYGPIEDGTYWQRCEAVINALPANISVEYRGSIAPEHVSSTFARYDLFAFPTHGENFGHVIFEALRAGTPVLVSDQTPWRDDASGAITVAPLHSFDTWRAQIELAADRNEEQQRLLRAAAVEYARCYARSDQTRSDNLKMFIKVAGREE